MDWRKTLTDIFAGYLNQDTLEEGVRGLLFVSEDDPVFHQDIIQAIDDGLQAASRDDPKVLEIINRSGYQVATTHEACNMLLELRRLYLDEYNKRTKEC